MKYFIQIKQNLRLLSGKLAMILFLAINFLLSNRLVAQIPDTLPPSKIFTDTVATQILMNDTISVLSAADSSILIKKEKKKAYPNPKKAAMLGLAIPGAGHIYNKKYWKAPVIWSAFAGGVYAIQYNTSRHKLMKDAYCKKLEVEGIRNTEANPNPCPEISAATIKQNGAFEVLTKEDSQFDSAAIKRFRDKFDKNTQLSWIGLIGGHLVLNGVWTYVDAHLNDFDIDEDLSLKLRPSVETIALTNTSFVGASVILEF